MFLNRIKYILWLLGIVFSFFSGFGQSFYNVYGTSGNDFGYGVVQAQDSGYVIVGATTGAGEGTSDAYLLKLDSLGDLKWSQTFGGENVDCLKDVKLVSDGVISCGHTNSTLSGGYDIYLVKTDFEGNLIWEKSYGSPNWDFARSLALDHFGGIYITGETHVGLDNTDAFILKINEEGDSLWMQTYGAIGNDGINDIFINDSSQVFISGYKFNNEDEEDYWIARVDTSGTVLWENVVGGILDDAAHGIAELIPGELIVVGSDETDGPTLRDNVYYIIDTSGNVMNSNTLGQNSNEIGIAVSSFAGDSSFILSSRTDGLGNGGWESWHFDCGYDTWGLYDFSFTFGFNGDDILNDVDTTYDKGMVSVGNMFDPVIGKVLFVHKTDSAQNTLLTYTVNVDPITLDEQEVINLKVFPNPIADKVCFEVESKDPIQVVLTSLEGKQVLSRKTHERCISIGSLPQGIYLLSLNGYPFKLVKD